MAGTEIRIAGGTVELTDHGDYQVFSGVGVASTQSTPTRCFNYTVGNKIPGGAGTTDATAWHTNTPKADGLLPEEEMLVFGAAIELPNASTLTTVQSFMGGALFEFFIGGTKPYMQGHIGDFPAGAGIDGILAMDGATAATTISIWRNGAAHPSAIQRIAVPHYIKGGKNFTGNFSYPKGAVALGAIADIFVRTRLIGLRNRMVE